MPLVWPFFVFFLLVDLFLAMLRAALLNARLPQLIELGSHDEQDFARTPRHAGVDAGDRRVGAGRPRGGGRCTHCCGKRPGGADRGADFAGRAQSL